MKRVTIVVTHLLGTGHLSRTLTLAKGLADRGFQSQVISGGFPAPHLHAGGVRVHQLPPLRSDGTEFTRLLDESGRPAMRDRLEARQETLLRLLGEDPPDIFVTELFPFGRRILADEFEAALRKIRAFAKRPLVFCSVRDVLAPPSSEAKAVRTEEVLRTYFDGVLVHGDPETIPLEASWPVTPSIAAMLHYTGYVAPPDPTCDPETDEGRDEIVVTAGGGPVGRGLFEAAIGAAKSWKGSKWRLLVGGANAADVCRKLNRLASGAAVLAEPVRRDYRSLLRRCAAAVGQCGYNTAVDWLQAGVAGVFVPFAEAGETEQTVRAAAFGRRYGYAVIPEQELTAERLARETRAAVRRGPPNRRGVRLDGAAETSRILEEFLEGRE